MKLHAHVHKKGRKRKASEFSKLTVSSNTHFGNVLMMRRQQCLCVYECAMLSAAAVCVCFIAHALAGLHSPCMFECVHGAANVLNMCYQSARGLVMNMFVCPVYL